MSNDTNTPASKPCDITVPEGFTLNIPARFKDGFLIPLRGLGTWENGSWKDKAPSSQAMNWQKRALGYAIPAKATGYGLPAGKNNLVIIDLDQHKDEEDGIKNFQWFIDEYCDGSYPKTYEVQTGSGAKQLFFKISDENKDKIGPSKGSTKNGLAAGVDVRAADSYVVGPGSLITQPDNTPKKYLELTPERDIASIEDFPALYDILVRTNRKAGGDWMNPRPVGALASKAKSPAAPRARKTSTKPAAEGENNPEKLNGFQRKVLEAAVAAVREGNYKTYFTEARRCGQARIGEDLVLEALGTIDNKEGRTNGPYTAADKALRLTQAYAQVQEGVQAGLSSKPLTDPDDPRASFAYYAFQEVRARYEQEECADLRFVIERNQFIRYDGLGVWEYISDAEVKTEILKYLRKEFEKVMENDLLPDSIKRLASKLVGETYATNLLREIKASLNIHSMELNKHSALINCANGLYDAETGEIGPFRKDIFETRRCRANYNPEATSVDFDNLLTAVDEDARDWYIFQQGKAITGRWSPQDFMLVLTGNGSNGKSSNEALFQFCFGNYAGIADSGTYNQQQGTNFKTASLEGLRLAVANEVDGSRIDESVVKRSVSSPELIVERKGIQPYVIKNEAHPHILANTLPIVVENNDGIWRRLVAIKFNKKYKTTPDPANKNELQANPHYTEEEVFAGRLPVEAYDTALTRALEAAHLYMKRERKELPLPRSVDLTTKAWRNREDLLLCWMEDELIFDKDNTNPNEDVAHTVSQDNLYACYEDWCHNNGSNPVRSGKFRAALEAHDTFIKKDIEFYKGKVRKEERHSNYSEGKDTLLGILKRVKGLRFKTLADAEQEQETEVVSGAADIDLSDIPVSPDEWAEQAAEPVEAAPAVEEPQSTEPAPAVEQDEVVEQEAPAAATRPCVVETAPEVDKDTPAAHEADRSEPRASHGTPDTHTDDEKPFPMADDEGLDEFLLSDDWFDPDELEEF